MHSSRRADEVKCKIVNFTFGENILYQQAKKGRRRRAHERGELRNALALNHRRIYGRRRDNDLNYTLHCFQIISPAFGFNVLQAQPQNAKTQKHNMQNTTNHGEFRKTSK